MENNKQTKDIENLENSALKDSYVGAFMLAYGQEDYETAIEIIKKSASLGNKKAQFELGYIYERKPNEYGVSTAQDPQLFAAD